jgi:[CysO sulfur-carrier protein]-S-L-cysteine hydrolase
LRIARALLDQIVAQARAEAPNECCGIVGARDGRAVRLFQARNARASPLAYEIDPRDLVRIYDELDEQGLDVGIIYHSHTRSAPEPSQTDINLASYPHWRYLIVSLEAEPVVRAWRIADGRVEEEELDVLDG